MTNSTRMIRVELGDGASELLSEAELARLRVQHQAEQVATTAAPAPAPSIPDFTASDAEILRDTQRQQPAQVGGSGRWSPQSILIGILGVVLALALVVGSTLLGQGRQRAATVAATTAAPLPTALAATATPLMLAVYWSPGGEQAAMIAASSPMTPSARFGQDWLQESLPGGAKVWLKLDAARLERTATFLALPDLMPPTVAPAATAGVVAATNSIIAQPPVPLECTPARWVAIVADERGYVGSCISVQAAQSLKPGAPVVASNADEAAAWLSERSANDQHGAALNGLPTPTPMR